MNAPACADCGYPMEGGAGSAGTSRCTNPHHPIRPACTNCNSTQVHTIVWDGHAECSDCAALFSLVDAVPEQAS
ncbi:MAG: hypothetical protein KJO11_09260 [Gemmatimonadetes bacterium]|nr:hypothetical protein [Gemmatimonadota bacterium]MBT8402316.1 hypothetical protein [Gemmatimonadota bacterium]NNF39381.1 hypothetical protein [Gemmatimonadota bacterium]NNK62449.1 hypothetical protein [Gemmatimonadota bacterium]